MTQRIGIAAAVVAAVLGIVAVAFFLAAPGSSPEPSLSAGTSPPPAARTAEPPASRATPAAQAIRSERFDEGAAPANAGAGTARRLEIEVIGPRGTPAAGAKLFIHRGEDLVASGTTGPQGVAAFDEGEGEAQLWVVPEGGALHRTTISLLAGRHRVLLPAGVSITGRVEVNGERPRAPLRFQLGTDPGELPRVVWAALLDASLTTTWAGDFELAGAAEGSEWRVVATMGYRLDGVFQDEREVYVIVAPANRVLVKLTSVPVVRGRVVSEKSRVPIAHASCSVRRMGPAASMSQAYETGDDGRFAFPIVESQIRDFVFTRIDLTVTGRDGIGSRNLAIDPMPAQDLDLGDIELPESAVVRFALRDPSGNPIEGGIARVGLGNEPDRGSRTDAQGRGAITVAQGERAFAVGALRFEIADVAIPEVVPDLIPVTLNPGCGLEVTVRTAPGIAPSMVRVRLSAKSLKVFSRDLAGNHSIHVAAGATANGSQYWDPDGAAMDFAPDAEGRVVIAGLNPGVALTVAAVDGLGQPQDRADVTLRPAEWRSITLGLTKPPRLVRGRVRDASGQPVKDARVELIPAKSDDVDPPSGSREALRIRQRNSTSTITDDAGSFELSGFFESKVDVTVVKAGYLTSFLRDVTLPAENDRAQLELTLQRSCRVTVKVSEANGSPIRHLWLLGEIEGHPEIQPSPKEPGVYVFTDVPPDCTMTVTFQWASRKWTRVVTVKGDQTEQITMPGTGKLVVDVSDFGLVPPIVVIRPVLDPDRPTYYRPGDWLPEGSLSREIALSPFVAGDYTVTAEEHGPDGNVIVAAEQRVTVRAGETTRIALKKP